MKSIYGRKWVVIVIAIICTFLWGSAFPVLKLGYEELKIANGDTNAQMVFAGLRFLLAGIILLSYLFLSNRELLLVKKKQIPILIVFGIMQTTVQYYFFYIGLANVSGMQGAILSSSGSFLVVILAHFFYKNDRLNWRKAIGVLAGFSGILAANWGQNFQFQFEFTAEGFMILSGLTIAITTIMTKELSVGIHPVTLTAWQLTIGSLFLLLIGLPNLDESAITFTPFGYGLLIYAAFLSAIAFALWTTILKYNKAGELSIYNFLTPVFGAVLSALIIPGEDFNVHILTSILLVAMGIFVINHRGNKEGTRVKDLYPLKKAE